MSIASLLESANFDGIHLDLTHEGKLHYSGDPALIAEWLPTLRANKSAIVAELHRERRHKKVLSMMGNRKYGILVEDDRSDPVICTCGIRDIATFDLAIPLHSYNGFVLLELIEKHSTETRPEPSQSSGDATTLPDTREARMPHSAGRGAA